ncbi:MAG: Crp/Fnr family transcriptional regulator [Verrucomicrobia bacterium]|nr:Crp/Fnr family transcriptional regulator [Verrucomicrobiota bacterium]
MEAQNKQNNAITTYRQSAIINTLRHCRLFQELELEDLRRIADTTVITNLDKDEYLFHEGDPAHGFYVIQQGTISVNRVVPGGKEQVIHVFKTGESFAELAITDESGFPADAKAVEPSQLLFIRKREFIALIKQQPELSLRILGALSQHLKTLLARLEDISSKDVETRLIHWLIKRCPNPDSDSPHVIEIPTTKRVLAAELGTVSETLSRAFADFRERALIRVHGRKITVLSPARLTTILQQYLDGKATGGMEK